MARLPRLTIGARMLQFAQRKLGTYASSGVTPVPPRVRQRGVRSGEFDATLSTIEDAPTMSAELPETAPPIQRAPQALTPPPAAQPRAGMTIINPEATEYAADDPDFQRLQHIMRMHEQRRQEQLQRQAEKQAEHPELVPKPSSNRGIRRRAAFDYVNTEAIRDDSAPAATPAVQRTPAAQEEVEVASESDDDSHSAPELAKPPPSPSMDREQRPVVSDQTPPIQRRAEAPNVSDQTPPIQRQPETSDVSDQASEASDQTELTQPGVELSVPSMSSVQRDAAPSAPAPSPRRSPAGESLPSSLEGLDEVTLLQAFTEVQRSPLPPRQKPYLPPPVPTQEQVIDAMTEAGQFEPPPS
ncbi:MAG: hypothetical protein SNJ54_11530, partial [Anaerolineae bacterium]